MSTPPYPTLFRFDAYPVSAFRTARGANAGDLLWTGDAAIPGDVYAGPKLSEARTLAIADSSDGGACVASGSEIGADGALIEVCACATLMGPDGQPRDLLLIEVGAERARFVLPLADLRTDTEYELLACDRESAPDRLADVISVTFLAGTHLTLADGRQVAVDHLKVGDRVLTRTNGVRPVRWIGHQTRRAEGPNAPVRISAGTLNAARDLRLNPNHRLFVWQREDAVGAGRAELMVKASALVNGTTVQREPGGYHDTYQLLFDSHEVIYAEGIAVESMLVSGHLQRILPDHLDLGAARAQQAAASDMEIDRVDLDDDAAERLRRASQGDRPERE